MAHKKLNKKQLKRLEKEAGMMMEGLESSFDPNRYEGLPSGMMIPKNPKMDVQIRKMKKYS